MQQGHAEPRLQPGDRLGHGGLGQAQRLCGSEEPVSTTLAKIAQASRSGKDIDAIPSPMVFHHCHFFASENA
jgi:hypothetical protein